MKVPTLRLREFEATVYAAFATGAPEASMPLVETRWRSTVGKDHRNDDEQQIERILSWRPWPHVVGYRLAIDPVQVRNCISVPALAYYAPAVMLTAIYLNDTFADFPLEADEYFYPPRNRQVREAFSGYGALREGDPHDERTIQRLTEFREALSGPQRAVCREFLRLYFELRWEPARLAPLKKLYDEALAYWA